jgi:hypothetical protein
LKKPRRGRKNKDKYFCKNCLDRNYLIECECGCGELLFRYNESGALMRFKNRHQLRKGINCHTFKTGRMKMGNNYYMLRIPDYFSNDKYGRVLEHVYFFQEYHQCCLLPWGEIHHIIPVTKDYCNNMPWNLMGMTKSQHRKLTNRFKIYSKIDRSNTFCLDCGSNKTYIDKKGYIHWYNIENGNLCKNCWSMRYERNKQMIIPPLTLDNYIEE